MKRVFISITKRNFYLKSQISEYVLLNNCVPISPFMNFEYNLSGTVNKDYIRISNNSMIFRTDELWVFGDVSDGVAVEIYLAQKHNIPIKYFKIDKITSSISPINQTEVMLEDVSGWMWEWIISGKNLSRWHPRLRFKKQYPLVYTAYSKKNFYWQMHISKFCINKKTVPLNPFMLFRYFLSDTVPRMMVYKANAEVIDMCDELWVFGDVADGVYKEILQMQKAGKKVIFYNIKDTPSGVRFREIQKHNAILEDELINQLGNTNI